MDPLTHITTGVVVANLFSSQGGTALQTTIAIIASVLPDFDYLLAWDKHQKFSHSVFFIFLLALIISGCTELVTKYHHNERLFFLCFSVMGSHLFLDILVHGARIKLFWPFSNKPLRLHLFLGLNPQTSMAKCYKKSIFICTLCQVQSILFNPIFFVTAIGAVLGLLVSGSNARFVSAVTIFLVIVYVAFCLYQQRAAKKKIGDLFPAAIEKRLKVYPGSFSPFKWFSAVDVNGTFVTSYVDTRTGVQKGHSFIKEAAPQFGAAVEKSKKTKTVKNFLERALLPITFAEKQGDFILVTWRDLGYAYSPEVELFIAKVHLSRNLEVVSEEFRERW